MKTRDYINYSYSSDYYDQKYLSSVFLSTPAINGAPAKMTKLLLVKKQFRWSRTM